MQEQKQQHTWWYKLARVLLFLISLEALLTLLPIPQQFEAGIWHGNSYRDRLILQSKELFRGHKQRYSLRGYRDVKSNSNGLQAKMVVLGDSRFYGQYVDVEDTFSTYIQQNTSWEVLNLGLPGASIYEANDFILDDAIDFGPQLAILCYDINSSLMSVMTRKQGGSRFDVLRNFSRSSMSYRWIELSWYALMQGSVPVMSIAEYKENLRHGITELQHAGIDVVVVLGWGMNTDYSGLYTRARYERFREISRTIAQDMGLTVLDVEATMEGQDTTVMFVGSEQIHFSKKGHVFFAEHLIQELQLGKAHGQ